MEPNRPAQTKITLRGSVVDNAGMRIPNTRIDVRAVSRTDSSSVNENRPAPLLLETSREGEFSAELPPGLYEVCAYRFRESCRSIQLDEEQKTSADILITIHPSHDPASSDLLDERIRTIAGPKARNCGRVGADEKPICGTECALSAFRRHEPFYIRYDDSDDGIAHGVAGDSTGRVYFVDFHSISVDFSRLRPGATMPDGLHTEVTPCLQPVRMKRTRKGQLMCFIEDRWITR